MRELIDELGGKVLDLQFGKHLKVRAAFGETTLDLILPGTPGDNRALKNCRAFIKRRIAEERGERSKPDRTPRSVTKNNRHA